MVKRNHLASPLYVGDTHMDQEAAAQARVPFLHAAYGFGEVEEAPKLLSFSELPQLLEV